MDMFEKLKILTDAAKYDVACTSSGSDRRGAAGRAGQRRGRGHLPQLCRRRPVHLSFKGAYVQRLRL